MEKDKVPDFRQYMNPILAALRKLGGSASNQELYDQVVQDMRLSDEQLSIMHPDREDQTEVAYRMAWARTYLKSAGLIHNSSRGVWALTQAGRETSKVDPNTLANEVRIKIKGSGRGRTGGPHCLDHGRGLVSEGSALVLGSSVSDPVDAVHDLRRRAFYPPRGARGETDKL